MGARVEFDKLKQGYMTVDEYYVKLLELGLANLVPDPVKSQEVLKGRFIEGLDISIQINIPDEPYNSVREVYLEALNVEGFLKWAKLMAGEKENYGDLPGTGSYFLPETISFSQHLATQFSDEDYRSGPNQLSCRIEFDGASKGNPHQSVNHYVIRSGAGAIIRVAGGSEVWRLREGVGIATNNVAEYRALILGLRTALQKGFKHVFVTGDSLLVCDQIQGIMKTKNENMANLCKEALALKKQFASFVIEHVPRKLNSDADGLANQAIYLQDGQVETEVTQ